MKIKVYAIATLIWFVCAGCSSVKTMDENLDLNHAKVGLVVEYNIDESRFSHAQLIEVREVLAEIEQKVAEGAVQVIRLETLYDIEVANEKEESAYQYLLQITLDIPDFSLLLQNQLATVTGRLTIEDMKTQKTVYESAFRERPRGTDSLVEKIVKRLPGRFSPKTGGSLADTFEWLDPSALRPGEADHPEANAVFIVDEIDVNVQIKEAELWTPFTKYRNIYTKRTRHVAVKILNERGYHYAEVYIPFDEQTHIEELEARTITEDGGFIEVSPDQIHEVDLFPEYIFFSDAKAKKFTFPALEPGAIVEYMYTTVTESVAMWGDFQFQKTEPVLSSRFSLDVPAGMEFKRTFHCPDYLPETFREKPKNLSAWEKLGGYREKSSSKWPRKTYLYELSNLPAIPLEAQMPPLDSVGARLIFCPTDSTFPDLGNWYAQLIGEHLEANASVRAKAFEITQSQKTVEEKVRAIYHYIQEHFRYVAVELGIGKIVPEKPKAVAQNRYGDCKGLSALTIAMLNSIGIDAYPAVIRTKDNGDLDEKYVTFSQFNHMIVYVEDEEKQIWLDPTVGSCAFLSLPWQDGGVRALVIKPNQSHLTTTPTSSAEDNLLQTEWEVLLHADGGSTCQVQRRITGQEGLFLRGALGLSSKNEQRDWIRQQIAQRFPQAQLIDYQDNNLEDRDVPLTQSYQFSTPNALQKVGDLLLFPLPLPTGISAFTSEQRVHPMIFEYPFQRIDEMKIHLPEGYTVEELPEPVEFKNPFGSLKVSLMTAQNVITYRFQIIWNVTNVPPSQYEKVVEFQQELASVQQKHIILKNLKTID